MSRLRQLAPLAVAALCACPAAPIRLALPREPLPDLFAPATWTTTCEALTGSLGEAVVPSPYGRGCLARTTRPPLGDVELVLAFQSGSERFTSATLVRRDAPSCEREQPRPEGCGADPSPELSTAVDALRKALEQRLGPPLATLSEGRDRSAEWRPDGWVLTSGLYAPRGREGWRILVVAIPTVLDAAGRPQGPGERLGH